MAKYLNTIDSYRPRVNQKIVDIFEWLNIAPPPDEDRTTENNNNNNNDTNTNNNNNNSNDISNNCSMNSANNTSNTKDGYFIWVDMKSTGLDTTKDVILEIACIVTDAQLNIVAEVITIFANLSTNESDRIYNHT